MESAFSRTQLLLGEEGMQKLAAARVAVFGVGGVGGYCVEALVRSGIGAIDLIDGDVFSESNLNRQLHATYRTLGQYKADVAAERIREIAPACKVTAHKLFFLPETESALDFSLFDYVVDAIDTVTGKLLIVKKAKEANVPVICAMGAGNKLDATLFRVKDIYETSVCPLARVMRREVRKMGVERLKVVCSEEEPRAVAAIAADGRRSTPGSVAFVPSVAGLILAAEVVKDIVGKAE